MKRIFVSALLCLVMISAIFGVTAAAAEGPLNGSGVQAYGVSCDDSPNGSHKYYHVNDDPSCTVGGRKYISCEYCHGDFGTVEEYAATGHTYAENITSATCTSDGSKVLYCTECGWDYTAETYPATGHTTVIDPAVAATCTEKGLTEGSHCSVCGDPIKAQTVVDALGHTEVSDDNAKAATCDEFGLTASKHCSVCGETTVKQETVSAPGHSYNSEGVCVVCGKNSGTDNDDTTGDNTGGSDDNTGGSDDNTGGNTGSGSDDNTGSGSDDNTGSGSGGSTGGSGGSSSGSSSSGLDNVPKTGDITPYGLFFMAFMTVAIAAAWIGRRIFCAK